MVLNLHCWQNAGAGGSHKTGLLRSSLILGHSSQRGHASSSHSGLVLGIDLINPKYALSSGRVSSFHSPYLSPRTSCAYRLDWLTTREQISSVKNRSNTSPGDAGIATDGPTGWVKGATSIGVLQ